MRNWPRYSRGSLEAEEMTRPRLRKIFFSMAFLVTMSVPDFCPRLSHWSRSPGSIVFRFPLTPIFAKGCELYRLAVTDRLTPIMAGTKEKPTIATSSGFELPVYFDDEALRSRNFDARRD